MILICLKKENNFLLKIGASIIFALMLPFCVHAQGATSGLSLSVTPTLFEMSASPAQVWDSSIKVINNNAHELTVYASVVNFAPQGETGEGKFIPVFENTTDGSTLAEWIEITHEPIVIKAEQSHAIPLRVTVPEDASPGGHFAAILVGTRPVGEGAQFQVRTSQLVTSLFFVRIAGDVVENGNIREFRTTKTFVDSPEAEFEVRFENKGNVHLQPQGEIVITNMWGKERGIIPINHKTHFGNVLPESIRKFEFSWKGEPSFSDIGRYTASLTLAYGDDSRKFATSNIYFYVVPIKALSILLGSLILFILFITWIVKAYIKRMLVLAGVETTYKNTQQKSFMREGDVLVRKNVSLKAPMQKGVLDLKARMKNTMAWSDRLRAFWGFVVSYKIFFGSIVILLVALAACVAYFSEVTTEQRDYEIVIDNADADVTLSSEDIIYERSQEDAPVSQETPTEQSYELILVNSSDIPGAAASLQEKLMPQGYTIADLQSDFSETKNKTVIVYHPDLQNEALTLSKKLGNALLSSDPSSQKLPPSITIYIGNDYTGN